MARQLFENDVGIVRFHDDGAIVHHEFKGRAAGVGFQEVLSAGLAEMIRTGAQRWLSDDRKHTVLDEPDERWARTVWFPKAAAAGWKYWAIVNPEKAVGQMQTVRHVKFMELGGVKVATFSTVEAALEWLRTIDDTLKKTG